MEAAQRITKLCEGWQDRLASSSRNDQSEYALQLLSLLGWAEPTPVDISPGRIGTAFILRSNAQTALVAQFVMPGSLDSPSTLVGRGLDYCACTRTIVSAIRQSSIQYAFITDLFRSYLYDVRTDELLLYSDSPELFNRDMAPVLEQANIERGGLEDLRREPRSFVARQLRECCHHWIEMIAMEPGGSETVAESLLDRLILLRFLTDRDLLKGSRWKARARFAGLLERAFSATPSGIGQELRKFFHDIWHEWKVELYAPCPELEGLLEQDSLVAAMLKDFAMMSKGKFSIATILESFNYGEATEKARVRLVPEPDEERDRYIAVQTLETIDTARIEIDVLDEGYRAIFYWFEKMVRASERLGVTFDTTTMLEHSSTAPMMDLFEWSEADAARPEALRDAYQHVVENGLRVYYATPRQGRTTRLLLYLYIADQYWRTKTRFSHFPNVGVAMQERPATLEKDTRRIFR